jgi:hypothetical protein
MRTAYEKGSVSSILEVPLLSPWAVSSHHLSRMVRYPVVQGLHLPRVWSAVVESPAYESKVAGFVVALVVVNVVALKMLHSLNRVECHTNNAMDICLACVRYVNVEVSRLLVQVRVKFVAVLGEYLAI